MELLKFLLRSLDYVVAKEVKCVVNGSDYCLFKLFRPNLGSESLRGNELRLFACLSIWYLWNLKAYIWYCMVLYLLILDVIRFLLTGLHRNPYPVVCGDVAPNEPPNKMR